MLGENRNKIELIQIEGGLWVFCFFRVFFVGSLHTCAVNNFILCQLSMKHVGKDILSVRK